MAIGERAWTRYIRHPVAGSGLLRNGDAVDSGTMIIAHSNVALLEQEMARPLAYSSGFAIQAFTSRAAVNTGLSDYPPDITSGGFGGDISTAIPWDPRMATMFGPFPAVHDRFLSSGDATRQLASPVKLLPRKVRVTVGASIDSHATETQLLCAMTTSTSTPTPANAGNSSSSVVTLYNSGTPAAFMRSSFGGTGTKRITIEMDPIGPIGLRSLPSRAATSGVSGTTAAPFYYVWVGWLICGTSVTTSYIIDISVREVR